MRGLLLILLVAVLYVALGKKKATSSKGGSLSFSSAFGYKDQGKKGKKSKSSAMVAIPRKKSGKGGGLVSGMSKIGGGLMMRMAREMRTQFSSELEALTLQLTRPTDAPIPAASSREIADFFNGEYDNPQVVVSVLAKLSRKLSEPSVYTKLKSLLTVNTILSNANSKGQMALAACMKSLQQEVDSKVGLPFFSFDSVEQAKGQADSVGEIELAELAREYATFLFYFINIKAPNPAALGSSKKSKKAAKGDAAKNAATEAVSKAEGLLKALELISAVEAMGAEIKASKNKRGLVFQVLENIKSEKAWIGKQLQKAHASGALASASIKSVESALSEFGLDYEPLDGAVYEDDVADDGEIESLTKDILGVDEEKIEDDEAEEDEDEDEDEDEEEEDEEEDEEPTRRKGKSRRNR